MASFCFGLGFVQNVYQKVLGPNDNYSRCLLSDSDDRDGRIDCQSSLNVFLKLIWSYFPSFH